MSRKVDKSGEVISAYIAINWEEVTKFNSATKWGRRKSLITSFTVL